MTTFAMRPGSGMTFMYGRPDATPICIPSADLGGEPGSVSVAGETSKPLTKNCKAPLLALLHVTAR
jgi:hypothetical protein